MRVQAKENKLVVYLYCAIRRVQANLATESDNHWKIYTPGEIWIITRSGDVILVNA